MFKISVVTDVIELKKLYYWVVVDEQSIKDERCIMII